MCLEGASTIVCQPQAAEAHSEFLERFLTAAFEPAYLPLHLFAFHEHQVLLDCCSHTLPAGCMDAGTDVVEQLEQARNRALLFRLNYHFRHVSDITMHNTVYEGLRRALRNDVLMQRLDGDTADIAAFLVEKQQQETQRRLRWLQLIAAGGAIYVTAFAIVKETLESLGWLHHHQGMLATGIALAAVLFGVGAMLWFERRRRSARKHSLTKRILHHVLHENILHRMRK